QLKNVTRVLEESRKSVEVQIKTSLEHQQELSAGAADAQRTRHLRLLFTPIKDLPTDPRFKELLTSQEIDERKGNDRDEQSRLAKQKVQSSFMKATKNARKMVVLGSKLQELAVVDTHAVPKAPGISTGGALTNHQRSILLTVFQRYVLRGSGQSRCTLMQRCTWFRFLVHCKLIGPESPENTAVSFASAAKIFRFYTEAGLTAGSPGLPVLTFSGWANAAQCVIRKACQHASQQEVVTSMFEVYLISASQRLGMKPEELQGTAQSLGQSGRASLNQSRNMSVANTRSMSFSYQLIMAGANGGSSEADDGPEDPEGDASHAPLLWHVICAEEQMCEPESLQIIEDFRDHFEQLFLHYTRKGGGGRDTVTDTAADSPFMSPGSFKRMLQELHFFPELVQTYSLQKHLAISQARAGSEQLNFETFVEILCRIAFVHLCIYGNSAQQASTAKSKCVWLLAMIMARLPPELLRAFSMRTASTPGTWTTEASGDPDRAAMDASLSTHAESIWQTDTDLDISDCPVEELILWQTINADSDAPEGGSGNTMARMSTGDFNRLMSE
ncbi:unnamed protein product, partial [Polarella glacialis]